MAASIDTIFATLEARANALRTLVDDRTHRHVILAVQRAFASISTCGELLLEVRDSGASYVGQKIAAAQAKGGHGVDVSTYGSFVITYSSLDRLQADAELISEGRDVDVLKQLGWRTLEAAAKLLAKLSGVSYAKDAVEIAEAFKEVLATGEARRLRQSQARMASDLLDWLDATTFVGLGWCHGAQRFLLGAAGKGQTPDDEVTELVLQRVARRSRTWHP